MISVLAHLSSLFVAIWTAYCALQFIYAETYRKDAEWFIGFVVSFTLLIVMFTHLRG